MELFGSEIFSNKDKNDIELNPENIHDEFMKPFDDNEVVSNVLNPIKTESPYHNNLYYRKLLPNGLEYDVYEKDAGYYEYIKKDSGRIFEFSIFKHSEKKTLAQFRLTEEVVDGEQCLNLHHRQTKVDFRDKFDISGSDFLNKAKEYLQVLKRNRLINVEKIKAEVSQYSVLSWLMKNDFNILEKNRGDLFNCFKNKNGELIQDDQGKLILNDEYMLIPFEDRKHGGNKDEYIIKKDFITNPIYENLRKRYYKDGKRENRGKKVLIKDLANNMSRGGNVVHDLIKEGLMPRFILETKI